MSSSHTTDQFSSLYDTDFYAWTQQQAKILRDKQLNHLDIENLIEEIESLGRQERRELENRLGILLGHLLKWQYQPGKRSKSWFVTIREQRFQVLRLIKQNPSLKPYLPEAVEAAYQSGLNLAVNETTLGYKAFPEECLYSVEQMLDSEFFPGEQSEALQEWQ